MKSYPDSTYKMLAYASPYITFHFDDAVDWACEMLEYGYETPHLLMLAAIIKPTSRHECEYYLENALVELNLKKVDDVIGTIFAVWQEVSCMAKGEQVRFYLTKVYQQYSFEQPNNYLSDFTELYWAWDDLEKIGAHYGWNRNLILNNIEQEIIEYSKKWIELYKPEIEKLILPGKNS